MLQIMAASPPAPVLGMPGEDGVPTPELALPTGPTVMTPELVPGCPVESTPCVPGTGEPFAVAWNDVGERPPVSVLPTGALELTLQRKPKSAPWPAGILSGVWSVKLFEP